MILDKYSLCDCITNFGDRMAKFRIAVLDDQRLDDANVRILAKKYYVEVEIISALDDKPVDAIVIGNNLGKGVRLTMTVPKNLRDQVVVMWNDFIPGNHQEASYTKLGIKHFTSRKEVPDYLAMMLNIPPEIPESCEHLAPPTCS